MQSIEHRMNQSGYQGHSDHSQANIKNGSNFGAVSLSTQEAQVEEEATPWKVITGHVQTYSTHTVGPTHWNQDKPWMVWEQKG